MICPSSPPSGNDGPRRFRLPTRDLLLLVLALVAGVGAGLLLAGAGMAAGQAIIGGCTAFAGTLFFFDRIVD